MSKTKKTKTKTKKSVKRPVRTIESRELLNATGGACANVDPTGIAGLPDGIPGLILHPAKPFIPPEFRGVLVDPSALRGLPPKKSA
jgi:hypothetical protein